MRAQGGVCPETGWQHRYQAPGLFFSLPLGSTDVMGAMGRSEDTGALGAEVSFFGFLAIFSFR